MADYNEEAVKRQDCKLCGTSTQNRVKLNFELTPICDECCSLIMLQQVKYLAHNFTHIEPKNKNQ